MRFSLHVIAAVAAAGAALAGPEAAKPKAPKPTAELLVKGRAAFEVTCATCHGTAGDGNGPAGLYLKPKPRHFGVDPFKQGDSVEAIFATLETGVPASTMVAFAHLPEEDRWALSWYVAHFLGTKDGKKAKAIVAALPPLTPPATAVVPTPPTATTTPPAPPEK